MAHRGGWRYGGGGLAASGDHLSAERFADVVNTLRSASPESATKRLFLGTPQQRSAPEPARRQGAVGAKFDGSVPVVTSPANVASSVSVPAILMAGRHRRPTSPGSAMRSFAFTSRRLEGPGRHRC